MDAFSRDVVSTRNAYIAIEHEWMHLETLAYMLAQEQRMGCEGARGEAPAAPGTPIKVSPLTAVADMSSGSSDDEAPLHANDYTNGRANGCANGHANGRANGYANDMHSNGHAATSSSRPMHGHSNSGAPNHGKQVLDYKLNICSNGKASSSSFQTTFVQVPSGSVTLGLDMDPSKNFAWDNEGPQQQPQPVSSFQAASHSISNAQYFAFAVTARGYDRADFWDAKDLAVMKKRGQKCPATWTLQVMLIRIASLSPACGYLPSCSVHQYTVCACCTACHEDCTKLCAVPGRNGTKELPRHCAPSLRNIS